MVNYNIERIKADMIAKGGYSLRKGSGGKVCPGNC